MTYDNESYLIKINEAYTNGDNEAYERIIEECAKAFNVTTSLVEDWATEYRYEEH